MGGLYLENTYVQVLTPLGWQLWLGMLPWETLRWCRTGPHCVGTGMGRMLATRHPPRVLTSTWFIKKRVVCAAWPAAPIVNTMGTYTWALVSPSIITRRAGMSGSKRQVP